MTHCVSIKPAVGFGLGSSRNDALCEQRTCCVKRYTLS